MKARLASSAFIAIGVTLTAFVKAAEPLPTEELSRIQITLPTAPSCQPTSDDKESDCSNTEQLDELTRNSIKESLETDPAMQMSRPSLPPPSPEPNATLQQQQIIKDFTNLPWGR